MLPGKFDKEIDQADDVIDLRQLLALLISKQKIIRNCLFIGIAASSFIAFSTKRTWQGEFQIVLDVKPSLSSSSGLGGLAGLKNSSDGLKTEVEILKSPSLLIDIFEFVKSKKKSNDSRFKSWQNSSIDIYLEKGTSVLNLAYRDSDKDIILPVLSKISSAYQQYSGSKRLRTLELSLDYFKKQIEIFRAKSIESSIKSQQFAIDQDLSLLGKKSEIDMEIPNIIDIEQIRLNAANEIKVINHNLKMIQEIEGKSEKLQSENLMYIASTIPNDLANQLKIIDSELERSRRVYTEKDKIIKDILEERKFLINLTKRHVKGSLIAAKSNAQARMKAAERPAGVLIEYKMLLANAKKDKSTLNNLENEYRTLLLEEARSQDPWKLITKPTLLPNPVAPKRKSIVAKGLISGFLIGCFAALIAGKRKEIIFTINSIQLLVQWPLVAELPIDKSKKWEESINLFTDRFLSESDRNLAILKLGEIEDSLINEFIKSFDNNTKLIQTKDIREATKYNNLIILTQLGITKKQEIEDTNKKLLLMKKTVLGFIVLR